MTKFSISEYKLSASLENNFVMPIHWLSGPGIARNTDVLIDRMASLSEARRAQFKPAEKQHDGDLLNDGAALEAAWQREVSAWVAQRRTGCAESSASLVAARRATEIIVGRIEHRSAATKAGRKVKSLAAKWRRYGADGAAAAVDSL